jgi:DNA-binding MarR family transcriptional regulator
MTKKDDKQMDMAYKFDPTWIRVMSSIIKVGSTLKDIGPTAFTVMCVLRAYKNLGHWGNRYPSVKTVAERMGKTPATIHNALHILEEANLIEILKTGRRNDYKLLEGYSMEPVKNPDKGVLDARSPYDPMNQERYISDVKELAKSGKIPKGSVITIENKFVMNMTVVKDGGNAVIINSESTDWGDNPHFASVAKRMVEQNQKIIEELNTEISVDDILKDQDD